MTWVVLGKPSLGLRLPLHPARFGSLPLPVRFSGMSGFAIPILYFVRAFSIVRWTSAQC